MIPTSESGWYAIVDGRTGALLSTGDVLHDAVVDQDPAEAAQCLLDRGLVLIPIAGPPGVDVTWDPNARAFVALPPPPDPMAEFAAALKAQGLPAALIAKAQAAAKQVFGG